MDSEFYYAHWNLGLALEGKGAFDAAIEEYLKARALTDDPAMLGRLGHAYAASGRKSEALKVRDELQEIGGNRYVSAYSFAIICIGLGEKEEALRWLEKAYDDRAGDTMRMANVDFLLDPLRAEPRFKAIIKKIFPTDAGIAESSQ
jgi:tetratricopeptide (TPR) repeat protein